MKECLYCHACFGDHRDVCDFDASPLVDLVPGLPIINDLYRVDRRINMGTMGLTFAGISIKSQEKVTIKIVHPALLAADKRLLPRFISLMGNIAPLKHDNMVRVIDYGQTLDKLLFIVTEQLAGYTLKEVIDNLHILALDKTLTIVLQVCESIAHAHRHNVHHLNLKPNNIFIVPKDNYPDFVKVADFGLTQLPSEEMLDKLSPALRNQVFPLPFYLAPEQLDGMPPDLPADIYAVGALVYHMLSGHPPFDGTTYEELKAKHIGETPLPLRVICPDVPKTIDSIVMRCLEKRPTQRHNSMLNLAVQLAAELAVQKEQLLDQMVQQKSNPEPSKELPPTAPITQIISQDIATSDVLPISNDTLSVASPETMPITPRQTPSAEMFLKSEPKNELKNDLGGLSPACVIYLFANQFLPVAEANQHHRPMHNSFKAERERLAALLLSVAIFSLCQRNSINLVNGTTYAHRKAMSLRSQRNEGFLVEALDINIPALDILESKVLGALKKANPTRFYNIFLHIAQTSVATSEQEAICEIVNDCIAEELTIKKLLKAQRCAKPLKAGQSAMQYDLAIESLTPHVAAANSLQNWLMGLQKQEQVDLAGKPVQPFSHVLKYYTELFRHNSKELMSS